MACCLATGQIGIPLLLPFVNWKPQTICLPSYLQSLLLQVCCSLLRICKSARFMTHSGFSFKVNQFDVWLELPWVLESTQLLTQAACTYICESTRLMTHSVFKKFDSIRLMTQGKVNDSWIDSWYSTLSRIQPCRKEQIINKGRHKVRPVNIHDLNAARQ